MANVFKCGDIVALKSGGPQLTVREVGSRSDGSGQGVTAVWYEGSEYKSDYFIGPMLDLIVSAPD